MKLSKKDIEKIKEALKKEAILFDEFITLFHMYKPDAKHYVYPKLKEFLSKLNSKKQVDTYINDLGLYLKNRGLSESDYGKFESFRGYVYQVWKEVEPKNLKYIRTF